MSDRDSAGWRSAVANGDFVIQQCSTCDTRRFPPREFCSVCHSRTWQWQPVEPTGTIESWIVDHTFAPGTTIVMVRLTNAPTCVMYGRWLAETAPSAGQTAHAVFTDDALIDWH
ncbi:hypothetical protein J5X84_11050 [Streptosporangiaceae bacterium NEAU-GS5]|nr:hypothetical protein [Streptosporangiaceae bacterium NEAU-GS5]